MFRVFHRYSFLLFARLLTMILLASCATKSKESAPSPAKWNNNMHRLSAAMSNLTPYAVNAQQFYSEENSELIGSQLRELAVASAEIVKESHLQKNPLVRHAAIQFAQDMARASTNFEQGNSRVSQFIVSNVANHCINCHTSADRGTRNFPMSWATDVEALSPVQKAQFYLANRQYNSALSEAYKIAKDKKIVVSDPEGWRQTIERTLAMLVRVEDNVTETLKLVQTVSKNSELPPYIKRDSLVWLADAGAWARSQNKKLSQKEKYVTAVGLINNVKNPVAPLSHSGLITNLRASAIFQELVNDAKVSNYVQSLYFAGVTSELLPGLAPTGINETYYEVCIRARPRSFIAMTCYAQLENSVYASSPNFEFDQGHRSYQVKRLKELRAIADTNSDIQRSGPDIGSER